MQGGRLQPVSPFARGRRRAPAERGARPRRLFTRPHGQQVALFVVQLVSWGGVLLLVAPTVLLGFLAHSGIGRHAGIFAGSAGVAFLVGLGIVLGRRMSRARRGPVLLASLLVGYGAGAAFLPRGGTPRDGLEAEDDVFVAALERHHAETGRYPDTLAELGIEPAWNDFGGWHYCALNDGQRWHLAVGDYGTDGFILFRYSEYGGWDWDT